MGAELSADNRVRLAAMIGLHEHWARWQADRVTTLLWAADLVERRVLTVAQACTAFGVSPATWYRHMRALRPVRGSQTERDVVAEIDQALRAAGADETTTLDDVKSNPDLELALANIGVQHRTDTEDR